MSWFVPTGIYELLPFAYLLLSALCFRLAGQFIYSELMLAASALIGLAGLSVWTMRGYYRGYHSVHQFDYHYGW